MPPSPAAGLLQKLHDDICQRACAPRSCSSRVGAAAQSSTLSVSGGKSHGWEEKGAQNIVGLADNGVLSCRARALPGPATSASHNAM